MLNCFFFIVSDFCRSAKLNAWLFYKRSAVPFFALIVKCDTVMCLFCKFRWLFILHNVWHLVCNDVNYEQIVNMLHVLNTLSLRYSVICLQAACYNSLLFVFALRFREFACCPAPDLTFKVVNEVFSWFCGYIPGKQWRIKSHLIFQQNLL